MKILLLELPIDSWNRFGRHYLPNPGTLAIGTFLKRKGYEVSILDCYAEGIGWDTIDQYVRERSPDIVGMSSYTPDIYGRILLARRIKSINPSVITIIGGAHVTLVPEETLRLGRAFDYAVIGEGEETFLELIHKIQEGRTPDEMSGVKGLAYIHPSGHFVFTGHRPLIQNVDILPLPDYTMVPMEKYHNRYFPYRSQEGISCYFSRGCVAGCTFCSENILWQHSWRGRTADSIVEELTILNKHYGKKAFLFNDDDFLFDKKRNVGFIERMQKSGLRIDFRVGARVDTLLRNRDLLKELRKVGLVALQIGIESFNQKNLDTMHKGYDYNNIRELQACIHEANISFPRVFLIVGNSYDSAKSIMSIVREAKRHGFCSLQISTMTPWPGTSLYEEMKDKIKIYDYRHYDFKHTLMPTKTLSMWKINAWRLWLFYRWHFDLIVFMRNMANRYTRHFYFYTIIQLQYDRIIYFLIHTLKIWKLFLHNRQIDQIYTEHVAYIKKDI